MPPQVIDDDVEPLLARLARECLFQLVFGLIELDRRVRAPFA